MGPMKQWFRPPRHLIAWFLVVTVVPTVALFVLGWGLLSDSSDLTLQIRQRLQAESVTVVADLRQNLDALSRGETASIEAAGGLLLSFSDREAPRHAGAPVLFAPGGAADRPPHVPQSTETALAVLRVAQGHRASGRVEQALEAYGRLSAKAEGYLFGLPAPLQGALARVRLLTDVQQWERAAAEAGAVRAELMRGRWTIDRTSFQAAWRDLDLAERRPVPYPRTFALSAAVDALSAERTDSGVTPAAGVGRRSQWVEGQHVTALWNRTAHQLTVVAVPTEAVSGAWTERWRERRVAVSLLDDENGVVSGGANPVGEVVTLSRSESGLPWTIRVVSSAPAAELAAAEWRRRRLQIVLGLSVILGLTGAYFVGRAVRREFAVAQLQKDFVSAVSHEFRTPLTSMSHLLELLKEDRPLDEGRRRKYYDALDQETARLRRFVDSLLDFGRVESGVARYDLERVAPAALVSAIVDEFKREPAGEERAIEVQVIQALPDVALDQHAFRLVLRNLLENAVKYAPGPSPIRVEVATADSKGRTVTVRVRDSGPGIPLDEQQAVFEKFVRGAAARAAGIRGTGVGLALSRQIMRAHGGEIELASEPGHGSTFTITLPGLASMPSPGVTEHHAAPAGR